MSRTPAPLAAAYAACEAVARSHYENFPVASRLLPLAMRPHVAAVYAFARFADDLADEGDLPSDVRRERLAAWRERLHAAVAAPQDSRAVDRHADAASASNDGQGFVFLALAHSIRTLDLPVALFDDLVSAFAQDTTTTRYDSWRDLLDYCRRSANPVGRLVLRIGGYRDDGLDRASDALCTALQLTNFWQDFGRDWRAGRLYVPREVMDAHGAVEADLMHDDGPPAALSRAWSQAMQACVFATREQFQDGRGVCDGLRGRLRYELRLTWLGGCRILDRVETSRGRLMTYRPTLAASDWPRLLWGTARWGTA